MQDARAVARARHTRVRDAHHVADALLHQLGRDRQHAPFGHPGPALRSCIAQHQDVIGGHVEVFAIDVLLQRVIGIEHQSGAGVLEEARIASARLDDAAVGREVSLQQGQRTFLVDCRFGRADHVVVVDGRALEARCPGVSGDVDLREVEMVDKARHQSQHAAGIIEILHEVLIAGRPDVRDHRHLAAGGVEVFEADRVSGAPCHREKVDDSVGRASHRHRHDDRILECRQCQDALWRQVVPDHLDRAPAGGRAHPDMIAVGGGN